MRALLRQLRDGGMSVLLVEHDMGFVMGLADRIVVLDFGTKIAEGAPAAIKTNPDGDQSLSRSGGMSAPARGRRCPCRLWQGRGGACRSRSRSATTRSSPSSAPMAPARPRCSMPSWAFCRSGGTWPFAGQDMLAARDRGPRRRGPLPRARASRAVRHHECRGQSAARRLPDRQGRSRRNRFERVYALFPRLKERRSSSPAPCRAASSRCWRWAAP